MPLPPHKLKRKRGPGTCLALEYVGKGSLSVYSNKLKDSKQWARLFNSESAVLQWQCFPGQLWRCDLATKPDPTWSEPPLPQVCLAEHTVIGHGLNGLPEASSMAWVTMDTNGGNDTASRKGIWTCYKWHRLMQMAHAWASHHFF